MITGSRIMETMDPDQTLAPIMITGVALTMETMEVVMVLTMVTGGTTMITGVGLITMTMQDGEIMTVGLPMEIMAQITTAGEAGQAIGGTMKPRTIGATMETPHLTQTSFPPPPSKS